MDSKFNNAEGYTLIGLLIFVLIAFGIISVLLAYERTKRMEFQEKAMKYDAITLVIEGSDSKFLKNVVKALEKKD